MKKLFVMFAVSALLVSCGSEKTAETSTTDSTKCCADSAACDSTKVCTDSVKVDTTEVVAH
jgi:hypothetical protein